MNTFLHILTVIGFLIMVYYIRDYLLAIIEYKEARRAEIKRRLQVEHKQELALKHQLAQPLDDDDKIRLEIRAAHERHQRAIHYVIEDLFERGQ